MKKTLLLSAALLSAAGLFAQAEFLVELTPMTGAMQKIGPAIPGVDWIYPNIRAYDQVNGRLIFQGGTPTPDHLYSIDVTNGTVVSSPGFPSVGNATTVSEPQFDNTTSTLYGLYYDNNASTYHLATINPVTGVHTLVGTATIAGLNGLAQGMDTYDELHHRYIVYSFNELFLIDAATGTSVNVPVAIQAGDGIAQVCYNNANDTLYALQYEGSSQSYFLAWIDQTTGVVTKIGSGTTQAGVNGSAAIDLAGRRFIYSYSDPQGFYLAVMDMDNGTVLAHNRVDLAPLDNIINLKYDNNKRQLFSIHWDAQLETNGIAAVQGSSMRLYPNPASGQLSVALPHSYEQLQVGVYHLNGQQVGSYEFTRTDKCNFSVSGLSAGVYFLKIETPQEHFSAQFVKQ